MSPQVNNMTRLTLNFMLYCMTIMAADASNGTYPHSKLSTSRNYSYPGLPMISVPLPVYDVIKVAPVTLNDVSKVHHLVDDQADGSILSIMFPGQFFTQKEVENLSRLESTRYRRQLDGDICCRTKVWFGTAPKSLRDVSGEGPFEVLRAKDLFQAYARGECHDSKPRATCPLGGYCRQKRRLHMLWVQNKNKADLKYFKVNSHCAYEINFSDEAVLKSNKKSS